jgi:small-conductance mechanosensitive channel
MKMLAFIIVILFSSSIFADVFKCTDSNGKKIYQKNPCADYKSATAFNPATGTNNKIIDNEKQLILEQQNIQRQLAEQQLQQQEMLLKQQLLKQQIINESLKNQEWIKTNPKRYSAFAIPPYAENNHPEFADKFLERLPVVERYRRLAAEQVLVEGNCGRVEAVELNQRSKPDNLVFLIDCSSGESVLLEEKQILQPSP